MTINTNTLQEVVAQAIADAAPHRITYGQAYRQADAATRSVIAYLKLDSQRVKLPEGGCWTSCEEDEFNSIEEWLHTFVGLTNE